jgi:multidrug efflux system outer membrane protein
MKNYINHPIYAVLTAMLLVTSACKVSKDVSAPDMRFPVAYRDAVSADTSSIATVAWKDFFADPQLKSLIAEALIHNNDLQVAVKNIEAARLAFRQAKLGNVPTIDLAVSASTSRPSDNSLNGLSLSQYIGSKHIEDYTIAASLSWEADIWGKIRSVKASTLATYLQTQEARNLVQTQIVSDVAKGYYNLLMLDEQLRIARQNVALDDTSLRIISLQYRSGQVTSLAVQQARAQQLTAAGLIPLFENQQVVQENALSILIGKLPGQISRDSGLSMIHVPDAFQAGIPAQVLSLRPDVRMSEFALSKANADVGYTKANMYPSFTITAQGGLDAFKAGNWFNIPASLFGLVAGGVTQPLFDHKKLLTQYETAKINRDRSVIQFRQAVLTAMQDVSDAMVKLDKLRSQQMYASQKTDTLRTAIKNAQLLFNNGLANYLEIITTQENVLQSELELASIEKDRLSAMVDLYRSVGGGWAN